LRAIAEGLAAVLIGALGVADGGIGGVARGVLGLAVQVLHRAFGLTGAARGLGLSIACDIADSAFDFTGEILCRAGNSILVHRVTPCYACILIAKPVSTFAEYAP